MYRNNGHGLMYKGGTDEALLEFLDDVAVHSACARSPRAWCGFYAAQRALAVDISSNAFSATGKRDPGTFSSSWICVNRRGFLQKKILPRVSTGTDLYQFAPI
jgi:hypothetical protein